VLLVLSLLAVWYVDEGTLPPSLKIFAGSAIPISARLIPGAFFYPSSRQTPRTRTDL
jgi:hypothetical protein